MLLEIMEIEYGLSAGCFKIESDKITFDQPDVTIPLVQSTSFGRQANENEAVFCDGSTKKDLVLEKGRSINKYDGFRFHPRPSYNGRKIIFPYTTIYQVSRSHGEITITSPMQVGYLHKSDKPTVLWSPNRGVVSRVNRPGDTIDNIFDAACTPPQESYLLLSGHPTGEFQGQFPDKHFYVKIEAYKPRSEKACPQRAFSII
jgi:hypothetical protein